MERLKLQLALMLAFSFINLEEPYSYFGTLNINDHGVVNFGMNSAWSQGGAIFIEMGEHSITLK